MRRANKARRLSLGMVLLCELGIKWGEVSFKWLLRVFILKYFNQKTAKLKQLSLLT